MKMLAGPGVTLPPKIALRLRHPKNDLARTPPPWPGSASRIADADAVTLTAPAQPRDDGTELAIRY